MLSSEVRKWNYLRDVPFRDAQSPEMRALAEPIAKLASVSPWRDWAYAQLALSIARDLIVYVSDVDRVGREQIDGLTDPQGSTLASLERGFDDCDAKARLFVALCLCGGLQAHMCDRWHGQELQHVNAEVYLAGPFDTGRPRWWFAETILDRAKLGDRPEQVPVEKDTGSWRMSSTRRAA